jgi:hypothetical protein
VLAVRTFNASPKNRRGVLFIRKKTMAEFLRSLTPEFFDTLVIIVIIIGLALAGVRLYSDFTRKLPPERPLKNDTRHPPQA